MGSWEWTTQKRAAAFGAAVAGAGVVSALWWWKATERENDCSAPVSSAHQVVSEVSIPSYAVSAVIGQRGSNIQKIGRETGCKLFFTTDTSVASGDSESQTEKEKESHSSEEEKTQLLTIRGSRQSAQLAEVMVWKIVQDVPVIVTETILFPSGAIGLIIGRGGEIYNHIKKSSGVKDLVIPKAHLPRGEEVEAKIIGTADCVEKAKELIKEKIAQYKETPSKGRRDNLRTPFSPRSRSNSGRSTGSSRHASGSASHSGLQGSREDLSFKTDESVSPAKDLVAVVNGDGKDESTLTDDESDSNSASAAETVIEMEIPMYAVGTLIGREGSNIREMQRNSGAKLAVQPGPSSEGMQALIIRGSEEAVQDAKTMVEELVQTVSPMVTETVLIPGAAVGLVIGKGGEYIKRIKETPGLKGLNIPKGPRGQDLTATITGTLQAVEEAKVLIHQKVGRVIKTSPTKGTSVPMEKSYSESWKPSPPVSNDSEELSMTEALPASSVDSDSSPTKDNGQVMMEDELAAISGDQQVVQNYVASFSDDEEYTSVFVTAAENPTHFWCVMMDKAPERARMAEELAAFCSQNVAPALENIQVGDFVASTYPDDSLWYRARVSGLIDSSAVDVHFIDFGDDAEVPISKLRALPSEFTSLPQQAIDCLVEGIQSSSDDGTWSEEACDEFDFMAKIHREKEMRLKVHRLKTSSGKTYPCVSLYDPDDLETSVSDSLVMLGHAKRIDQS